MSQRSKRSSSESLSPRKRARIDEPDMPEARSGSLDAGLESRAEENHTQDAGITETEVTDDAVDGTTNVTLDIGTSSSSARVSGMDIVETEVAKVPNQGEVQIASGGEPGRLYSLAGNEDTLNTNQDQVYQVGSPRTAEPVPKMEEHQATLETIQIPLQVQSATTDRTFSVDKTSEPAQSPSEPTVGLEDAGIEIKPGADRSQAVPVTVDMGDTEEDRSNIDSIKREASNEELGHQSAPEQAVSRPSPVPCEDGEPEIGTDFDVDNEVKPHVYEDAAVAVPSPSTPSHTATSRPGTPPPAARKDKKAKGKVAKGKGGKGGKVEKLKASATSKKSAEKERSASASATPAPTVDSFDLATPDPDHRESSPVDTNVYCVCKKPYEEEDEDTVMIGCDRCENWFHPPCVSIAPDQIEMIDLFVCGDCEKRTTDRTVFKVKCKRPDCRRSVVGSASKYCSQACGMHHSLAKLRSAKKMFDDVYPAIAYAAFPEPVKVIHHSTASIAPPAGPRPEDLTVLLAQIEAQEEALAASVRVIQARQKLLERTIARAEALQPALAPAVEESAASTSKKSKPKKAPAAADNRACGYDSRLSADDNDVLGLVEDDTMEGEVCTASRRCDRHQGWQKTIAVALEVELILSSRKSDALTSQRRRIKSGVERQEKALAISHAFRLARAPLPSVHGSSDQTTS